ncbi:hypothetical protein pb186bvf_006558 [Paramecium bursaria]
MQNSDPMISIQSEDEQSGQLLNTTENIHFKQDISVRRLKLQYCAKYTIPYDCIVVVLNQRIISGYEVIQKINKKEIQILDVRNILNKLNTKLVQETQLKAEVKSYHEELSTLLNNLQIKKETIIQLDISKTEYEIQVDDLKKQLKSLQTSSEQINIESNQIIKNLQDQNQQKTEEILNTNNQLREQNLVIQDSSQKNLNNNLIINNYQQFLSQINQEFYENFGQQMQQGIITYIKNEQFQIQFQFNNIIEMLNQQVEELQEQMCNYKQKQEEKIKTLKSQNQSLDSEVQNQQITSINEKSIKTRLLQNIDSLKIKIKSQEVEQNEQMSDITQQLQTKEQQITQLTLQLKQYSQKISFQEVEILNQQKLEKDHQEQQASFKKQSEEYKYIAQLHLIEGLDFRTIHSQLQENNNLVKELNLSIDIHINDKEQLNLIIKSQKDQIEQQECNMKDVKMFNQQQIEVNEINQHELENKNENQNNQIGELKLLISQCEQKIQEDAQSIEGYIQYFVKVNQECVQSFGQQFYFGLLKSIKNNIDQQQYEANQSIKKEMIHQKQAESTKKQNRWQTDKQNLELEILNYQEISEKDKRDLYRLQLEVDELIRILSYKEDEIQDLQGADGKPQQQKLIDYNKQLAKRLTETERDNFKLKQIDREYQELQVVQLDETKRIKEEVENSQTYIKDHVDKLTIDLRNQELINKQFQQIIDTSEKQNTKQLQQVEELLDKQTQYNVNLKADVNQLNDLTTSLIKQVKDLESELDFSKLELVKSNNELNQLNQDLKSLQNILELETVKYSQQITNLKYDLQHSKKNVLIVKQLNDQTINNQQIYIESLQIQIDMLQERMTWLVPKLPQNQHKLIITSLIETIRIQLPVFEKFYKIQTDICETDFAVYRIQPIENLMKEILQGRVLSDQKILELQEFGEVKVKRSIKPTTENSDYFRGFVMKVTNGLEELINKIYLIRENKIAHHTTAETAIESVHNQFLAEYILKQFNLFLFSKGRQQSDLKFPATYIFQIKGEQKFFLVEEIQDGPFEKYLGGDTPIKIDSIDARFSNALALFSYYKSGKNMILSNLQTLNRVYHDTIICTVEGQLTNYDQGLQEINLIINQLVEQDEDFMNPFIVKEDEV